MTLIEGIGTEVIQVFTPIIIVLIAVVAWWSTNISERPLMRTVLILERRAARPTVGDAQGVLADLQDSDESPPNSNQSEVERKSSQSETDGYSPIEVNVAQNTDNVFVNSSEGDNSITQGDQARVECVQESVQDSIGKTLSEETLQSNSDREAECSKVSNTQEEEAEEASCLRRRTVQNLSSTESSTKCSEAVTDGGSPSESVEPTSEGNITVRLKYLNDDLRLVEGKLQEQLGDFKRRHFSIELSARKLVRLIFNGEVLKQDSKTLQNYGFFDNCVVHCLVDKSRTPPPSPNLNRPVTEGQRQAESPHHWDLGNVLFVSLSFLLGLAWYGRYQYAQLYTATTTVALVGLTGMFTVSLIGMYMPDVDGVRT